MTGVTSPARALLARRPVPAAAADLVLAGALAAASAWLDATALGLTAAPAGPSPGKLAVEFGSSGHWHAGIAAWWAATVVACAAVPARRRYPILAFCAAVLAAAVHLADPRIGAAPADLAAPFCLYAAALATQARRASLALLAGGLAACAAAALIAQATLTTSTSGAPAAFAWTQAVGHAMLPALALTAAWLAADAARARQGRLAALRQHARDLERDRDQQAALAAAAERSRITRELHDVIAHALSVMVVQAQAATAVLRSEPDTATDVLGDVITTGRQSLAEMRRILGAVRAQPGDSTTLAPQPGLAGLPELAAQVTRAGVPVRLDIPPGLPALPAAVDLSAYRIIQEALTNTIKHAGPGASATARITCDSTALRIDVADTGGSPSRSRHPAAGGGNGLRGITERVTILGGHIHTGPLPRGGFRVSAALPLQDPHDQP
jgi:signal transduction histidine kinase